MTVLNILTCNPLIVIAFISWVIAQLIKTTAFYVENKTMNFKKLSESGGMPSAHSALVCSVAVATAYKYGLSSTYFSYALILAMIVMYDAMGVRRAAGEHAKALNRIQEYLKENSASLPEDKRFVPYSERRLDESLGHRPIEVLGGATLGVAVAVISIVLFHVV
jgi:acid phosphatase family membrane protein YuiD